MNQDLVRHWQNIYTAKQPTELSWFQAEAETSLQLIESARLTADAQIIDVGGGASVLVDHLLMQGFEHITVLDLAEAALQRSQQRLGVNADQVNWLVANVLDVNFSTAQFDLWHDRAVFHFLITEQDRQQYLAQVLHALKSGAYLAISTFAEDGALKCSGLDVQRYSPQQLIDFFGSIEFDVIHQGKALHMTPAGNQQKFSYVLLRKK